MGRYLPHLKYTYPITVRFSALIGVLFISLGFLFVQKNTNIVVLEKIPIPNIDVVDVIPPTTIDMPKEPPRPAVPIESEDPDMPEVLIPDINYDNYIPLSDAPSLPNGPKSKFVRYDTPPEPLTPIRPKYPEMARQAGIEGTVYVEVFIDKKGRVTEASVTKGVPNTGLDEAAVEAIRNTRFKPAKQREEIVAVWVSFPIKFRLK